MVDPIETAKQRYREEREKRLRTDGQAQYHQLTDEYEDFDHDPFVEPGFTREPVVEDDLTAVIVGAGFGGMLLSKQLLEHGITKFKMIDKAGDFGGTWYWNRYPGCKCDVESLVYMPLLEETGYTPTMRYAPATEIFEHCQRIGETYGLYPHALFQTEVETAEWHDDISRWVVTTTRGDRLTAKFFVTAGGILHRAKLPAVEGIGDFAGRAFHTARWDYDYTGGGPTEPMDKLADKRVGVIGTGATAIQIVPELAKVAKEVYVFQRTPTPVAERNNSPIEPGWVERQPAGWQRERIANFTQCVTGEQPDVNMVGDGATKYLWHDTQQEAATPEEAAELERLDFEVMQLIRDRVDSVVTDPETAEKLKPWYGKHCKRICYHDEYLQAFNLPNVHLVDTGGKGVEKVTEAGPVVDGVEYPLDLLIYASGFEVTTGLVSRLGFDPVGKGGVRLSERWHDGAHTLHGIHTNQFPNMLVCHFVQAGYGLNFHHFLQELTGHLTWIVATAEKDGIETIEATVEAEEDWVNLLWSVAKGFGRYAAGCTPSYHNSESERTMAAARNVAHPGNLMNYVGYLERWRDDGAFAGVAVNDAS